MTDKKEALSIKENDVVWRHAPAIIESADGVSFLGMFATPCLVESVVDGTHVSLSMHGGVETVGKDVFLTREECIARSGPNQWIEDEESGVTHIDGPNMTPFAYAIPDDACPGDFIEYYLGYPYEFGSRIPWLENDDVWTFKDILDYIRKNKPSECPLKITLVSSSGIGGGSIYSYGFRDEGHWYMHGVTSSSWA